MEIKRSLVITLGLSFVLFSGLGQATEVNYQQYARSYYDPHNPEYETAPQIITSPWGRSAPIYKRGVQSYCSKQCNRRSVLKQFPTYRSCFGACLQHINYHSF